MPDAAWLPLWSCLLLAAAGALAIVLAALLERSGPVRLRHWAEEAGKGLLALYEAPARFAAYRYVLSLLAKVAPVLLVVALRELLAAVGVARPAWWAVGAVVALLAAVELLNRRLVARRAEESLRALTFAYRALSWLLGPLVLALALLAPAAERPAADAAADEEEDDVSDEEIEAFIELGTREGILEPSEGEMVWGIVDFGDTQVRSVMTPRVDMVVAPADDDLDALAERFLESGHSRIPLFEESIDHIVGILHIREVLRGLRSERRPAARELMKAPFLVPERKPLDELLKEMQARFQQMAIVLDEYGGTAGLVTVEDLLEEIVGEIFDEDEVVLAPEPQALPDGSWRLSGRNHVEVLDELLGVDVDEQPYETVGGLVLSVLGSVPEEGEVVDAHGLRFHVERVTGRRIQTVRVERLEPVEQRAATADQEEEDLE
jgi:CBS domain containing-hemolysin-like protein